jgi:hypothetical protein
MVCAGAGAGGAHTAPKLTIHPPTPGNTRKQEVCRRRRLSTLRVGGGNRKPRLFGNPRVDSSTSIPLRARRAAVCATGTQGLPRRLPRGGCVNVRPALSEGTGATVAQ